jgi:predicted RND superfamily exporter protein
MLACLSLYFSRNLVFDNSNESFFEKDDPAVLAIERFRSLFGNDDAVAVAIKTQNVFEYETLVRIKDLAEAIEKQVPYLKKTTWLGNVEYLSGYNDEITAAPLAEKIPKTTQEMNEFKKKAMSYPDYLNTLISEDGKIAIIVLECDIYPKEVKDPRKKIAPAIYSILKRPQFEALDVHLVGAPIQNYETNYLTAYEAIKLGLICLTVQAVLLFYFGRGLRAVMAPIVTIVLSIVYTIGIIGFMGWTLSLMTIMLPAMLLSVCLGDCVHIIADYHRHRDKGEEHIAAMISTIRECMLPCLITSLTTMLGFLSFISTDIAPIRMAGLYSGIGVGLAFILAITLTPVAYLIWPEKKAPKQAPEAKNIWLDAMLNKLVIFSVEHRRGVVVFFTLTTIVCAALFTRLKVETNFIKDLSLDIQYRRDSDFFDSRLGGAMALEIMVDSGRENGARDIGFLTDLEKLQRYAETNPHTKKTHSLVDTIKRVNEALHNEAPGSRRIPENQDKVSESIFFYEMSGGKNLDKELSFLSDVARVHVQTRTMSTAEVKAFIRALDAFIERELGGRLKTQYTGQMAWVASISDHVLTGQVSSLVSAAVSITIMMILALWSLKLGLISMLPNIVPMIAPFGLMWLFNVNVSIVLMVFSSVVIGICVDDTTHFYINFKRNLALNSDYRQALFETILNVGRPVTYTTVSLVLGFLVFALSDVRTTIQFGLLSCGAFIWGWLADLTFSPALLYLLQPLKKTTSVQIATQAPTFEAPKLSS